MLRTSILSYPNIIKEIPNGFPCLDNGYSDPNARDVARLEKSLRKIRAAKASVFSFSKVKQHPKCLDQGIQTQKTIRYFVYKITTVVI